MSIEITNLNNFNPVDQQMFASYVSAFTNGELGEVPQMMPVTPDEVFQKQLAFVLHEGATPHGFIAASQSDMWHGSAMTEVGTFHLRAMRIEVSTNLSPDNTRRVKPERRMKMFCRTKTTG